MSKPVFHFRWCREFVNSLKLDLDKTSTYFSGSYLQTLIQISPTGSGRRPTTRNRQASLKWHKAALRRWKTVIISYASWTRNNLDWRLWVCRQTRTWRKNYLKRVRALLYFYDSFIRHVICQDLSCFRIFSKPTSAFQFSWKNLNSHHREKEIVHVVYEHVRLYFWWPTGLEPPNFFFSMYS